MTTRAIDFFLLNAVATMPFADSNPVVLAWYLLCITLAFVLRLGMLRKGNKLNQESFIYQCICTVAWCFFMVLVWDYFMAKTDKGFEIYLFVNSLFAVFMVGQFEQIFEEGFKSWVRIKLGKFLATESKEEKT